MPNRQPRVVPPVYVENMPTVICDDDGVVCINQFGDTIYSWRMSRHKALGIAALFSAAVAKYEREAAKRGKIVLFEKRPGHG